MAVLRSLFLPVCSLFLVLSYAYIASGNSNIDNNSLFSTKIDDVDVDVDVDGSSGSSSSSSRRHLLSCNDIDDFTENDIRNLAKSSQRDNKKWYLSNCVNCRNINSNLDGNYRHLYYSKCIDCDDARDMSIEDIRRLRSKVFRWYEKKCGNFLSCGDLDDMTDIGDLRLSDYLWYQTNCITCTRYNNMDEREKQNLNDEVLQWYKNKGCTGCTGSNCRPFVASCDDLDDLDSNQIDDLSNSMLSWYKDNCIWCSAFNYMSNNQKRRLNSRIFAWYEDKCAYSRNFDLFDRKSSCNGCLKAANDFSNDCLDKDDCQRGNTIYSCYDTSDTPVQLANCCQMSTTCQNLAYDVQQCYEDCLPSCVSATADNYLDCTSSRSLRNYCDREDCFYNIALNSEWAKDNQNQLQYSSEDFFYKFADELTLMSDYEALSCNGAEKRASEACDIGNDCCENCNSLLSNTMHCIVNNVFRPMMIDETQIIIDCNMDCDNLRPWNYRSLQESSTTTAADNTNTITEGNEAPPDVTATTAEKNITAASTDASADDYGDVEIVFLEDNDNDLLVSNSRFENDDSLSKLCVSKMVMALATGGNDTIAAGDQFLNCLLETATNSMAEISDDSQPPPTPEEENEEAEKTETTNNKKSASAPMLFKKNGGTAVAVTMMMLCLKVFLL